jgi:hypothetical protein
MLNIALAVLFTTGAILVGFMFPAAADERLPDPFGNHTIELNKDVPLASIWVLLRDRMQIEKVYFHECLSPHEPPCPSVPTLVQKLDEIRQHRGKTLLGHLNITVNLMIKPAPSEWIGPLEAITMRNGDCKAYSLAKYAGAQELGISADHVRLVVAQMTGLNSVSEDTKQQVAGEARVRLPPEYGVPTGPKLTGVEITQARNLDVE